MKAEALKKSIYEKAKLLGVEQIHLHFSGGSDEGFLDITLEPYNIEGDTNELFSEIQEWAWNVYHYSGAGEGSAFGDDITYNLVTGKVTTTEWYEKRVDEEPSEDELEIN